MVCLWEMPAPKSGCSVTVEPMKLMMLAELRSTAAEEMSVLHRLLTGNGTKPLRLAPAPVLIPLQVALCAKAAPLNSNTMAVTRKNFTFILPPWELLASCSLKLSRPIFGRKLLQFKHGVPWCLLFANTIG